MKLSSRQAEILAFIRDTIRSDGLPPTRAEINQRFGFSSPNAAQSHLKALARKGAIRLDSRTARGIVPMAVGSEEEGIETGLPLIGRVAAGLPMLSLANQERVVQMDPLLFKPRPDYLLRVQGQSMRDAGILDGDLLAVHHARDAANGRIVVARLGDEVTVKRLRREGNRIWLKAENPEFADIEVAPDDEMVIEGLGVGVLRNL